MKQIMWKLTAETGGRWTLKEVAVTRGVGNPAASTLAEALAQVPAECEKQRLRITHLAPLPEDGLLFVLEELPKVEGIV